MGAVMNNKWLNPLGIGNGGLDSKNADPFGIVNDRGGDGKPGPAKRAAMQEAERQARMTEGTDRINAVFDSPERAAQLDSFLNALREQYRLDADRQKGIADRRTKFAMARSGLTGGSAAVDANRLLGEEYTRGLVGAEAKAQEAQGNLRSQDESSRLALINMIRSGMDATTGAQRAGAAMRANSQITQNSAQAEGLGNMFGATADVYKRSEEAAERRRGERAALGTLYGKSSFGGG